MQEKILVIPRRNLGDSIVSQSLLKFLKYKNKNLLIDVCVHTPDLALLFSRMKEVHEVFISPTKYKSFLYNYKLARKLRTKNYNQAIIISKFLKAALVPFLARIPIRTGLLGEMRFGIINDIRKKYFKEVEHCLNLGLSKKERLSDFYPLERFYPKIDSIVKKREEIIKNFKLKILHHPILCLCPGAHAIPLKKGWPSIYYAKVAQAKLKEGFQVIILGNSEDREISARIDDICHNKCLNLTGKTNLEDTIDILSLAYITVSNDSGLMHLACAVGCNVIAIYGATLSTKYPPLTKKAVVLDLNFPCKPCKGSSCPLGHLNCLNSITPDQVLRAIDKFNIGTFAK